LDSNELFHALSGCTYPTITVEAKMTPGVYSGFNVYESTSDKSNSFGVQFLSKLNQIRNYKGEVLADLGSGEKVAKIVLDQNQGQMRLFIDNEMVYSEELALSGIGGVQVYGDSTVDYVRVSTSGNRQNEPYESAAPDLEGNEAALENCDREAIQNAADRDARRSSVNVQQYCAGRDDNFCDTNELQLVVSRYPDCTKEAYNYCIDYTMPGENKLGTNAGLTGGVACSAVLGTASVWSGVVVPTTQVFWITATSNIYVALLILLVLTVLLPIIATRRRR
jgi:hypothetical protein